MVRAGFCFVQNELRLDGHVQRRSEPNAILEHTGATDTRATGTAPTVPVKDPRDPARVSPVHDPVIQKWSKPLYKSSKLSREQKGGSPLPSCDLVALSPGHRFKKKKATARRNPKELVKQAAPVDWSGRCRLPVGKFAT